jgi:acyl dehydratase
VVDPNAVGVKAGPTKRSWTSAEALLYALGVGAGVDELSFTTENSNDLPQQVLPTFGILINTSGQALRSVGSYDVGTLVHGGQSITLYRSLPASGSIEVSEEVTSIQDKGPGKHGIIEVTATGRDAGSGEVVIKCASTAVLRGQGGFGGSPGAPTPPVTLPDRDADVVSRYETLPTQALIYRLSGDRNPLHSDPWFATQRGGFTTPILHGLCTYGFAGRSLLHGLCGGDPDQFGSMSARFSSPVYPGEPLTTSIWRDGGTAQFRTVAGDEGRVVLDGGQFVFRDSLKETDTSEGRTNG